MASTTFVDNSSIIYASWLNDVNSAVYNGTFISSTITPTNIVCNGSVSGTAFNDLVNNNFTNRIINGAMMIDQRNAGASVTPTVGGYTLDRWFFSISQASKLSVQQNAGAVTPPVGFTKYLGFTSLSAYSILTTDNFAAVQLIEGLNVADLAWGTANAQTVTLSFKVYSSLTGTFGGSLSNAGGTRSYPFSYSIPVANTWTTISITISGDTAGTWATDNTAGIAVRFSLGTGSTFSGTAGAWVGSNIVSVTGATSVVGTNAATFYITGVQLEKGSTATSFDYRPYGTELALCQRYYIKVLTPAIVGFARTTTTAAGFIYFPVKMRTAPTAVEQSGTATDYLISFLNTASACSSVPTFATATADGAQTTYTVASGLTAGWGLACGANSANGYLGWSAEL